MSANEDIAFQLYKLEYEKGAERYENIYKSIWTNFSYLTIVAGGIIAFGSKWLSPSLTTILAAIPLFFWWLAVFEPMNKYGDEVVERLIKIEKILNEMFKSQLTTVAGTNPPVALKTTETGLNHFTIFKGSQGNILKKILRVRYMVRLSVLILLIGVLLYVYRAKPNASPKPEAITIDQTQKPLDIRIADIGMKDLDKLSEENEKIKQDLDELKLSMKTLSDDVKALKTLKR